MPGGFGGDGAGILRHMFTLRCTRKLLRRIGATPSSEAIAPSTVLGDWYANLLYTRPTQLVLAMSERSLLAVVVPAAPLHTLQERLRMQVEELLGAIGVPPESVAREVEAMREVSVGTTASRAVLGCMNDAVVQLQAYPRGRRGELPALVDLELHLAENIYSLTEYRTPWMRTLELFGVQGTAAGAAGAAGVVALRAGHGGPMATRQRDGLGLVLKAIEFAAHKHRDQRRKDPDKTPYINHPIALAQVLREEGRVRDPVVIAAALLHDTIEDTETTYDELRGQFGVTIADCVVEVTDVKFLGKTARKRLQVAKAGRASKAAKQVKLADKICNLRDILASPPADWSLTRQQEYFDHAKEVVDEVRGANARLERRFDRLYRQRPEG